MSKETLIVLQGHTEEFNFVSHCIVAHTFVMLVPFRYSAAVTNQRRTR